MKHLCSFTGQDDHPCPETTPKRYAARFCLSTGAHTSRRKNETARLSSGSPTSAVPIPVFVVAGTNLSSSSRGPGDSQVGELGGGAGAEQSAAVSHTYGSGRQAEH